MEKITKQIQATFELREDFMTGRRSVVVKFDRDELLSGLIDLEVGAKDGFSWSFASNKIVLVESPHPED